MNEDWTRLQAEKSLAQMLEWIARHDTRSAAATGITVAMLGALSTAIPPYREWTTPFIVSVIVTGAGFAFVLFQLLRGQVPRIRKGQASYSFFGSIASMPEADFQAGFLVRTPQDYLTEMLSQIHVNARIVRSKFRCLRRALVGLLVTVIPWTITIALGRTI